MLQFLDDFLSGQQELEEAFVSVIGTDEGLMS